MRNTIKACSIRLNTEPTAKELAARKVAMSLAKMAILEDSYETLQSIKEKDRSQISNDLFEVLKKKDKAYLFILESGNMEAFENYCKNGSVKISQEKSPLRIV